MNETYDYAALFVWGWIVLAAYLGYGRALARILAPSLVDRAGWGLLAVWGMSVVLLVGGLLLSFERLTLVNLDLIVGLGFVLLLVDIARTRRRRRGDPVAPTAQWIHPAELIPWGLLLVYYAGSIAWRGETDRNDDLVSYFAFPKLMLQTGTFHDPFAFRRMTTYGAQPFLQALTTARFGCEQNYHFVDCGLARVLFFGLITGALRPLRDRSPWLLAALQSAALILPVPRNNTTSELIHAVLLLTTCLTLVAVHSPLTGSKRASAAPGRRTELGGLVLCALVICAASSFRPHIGLSAAVLFSAGIVALGGTTLSDWRKCTMSIATTGGMVIALLTPWIVMLYRSSGTVAFPPFRGNLSSAFAQMHAHNGSMVESLQAILAIMTQVNILAMVVPLIFLSIGGSRLFKAVAMSALVLTVLTAYASTALSFPYFYRYVWPIPFAAMIFLGCSRVVSLHTASTTSDGPTTRLGWRGIAALAAAFSLAGAVFLPSGARYFSSVARSIDRQTDAGVSRLRLRNQPVYERAQQRVPPGEAILAMTDMPFLFDHARNRIMTIDAPGAVSPAGAMPFHRGAEATRRYLLSLGIGFIAYTPPETAILQYRRDYWEDNPRPERFYRDVWAPPMLDLMNSIRSFRSNSRILYESRKLEVLDLRTRAVES